MSQENGEIEGDNNELVEVTTDAGDKLHGFAYAEERQSAFLIDLGTGNGFLIGVKISSNEFFGSIEGDYKFINVWDDGRGAGNYSISSSGKVNWTHTGSDGSSSGSFQLSQCTNALSNVFYCQKAKIDDDYYETMFLVVVQDMMLHFGFDESNGEFSQYGIGARLDK